MVEDAVGDYGLHTERRQPHFHAPVWHRGEVFGLALLCRLLVLLLGLRSRHQSDARRCLHSLQTSRPLHLGRVAFIVVAEPKILERLGDDSGDALLFFRRHRTGLAIHQVDLQLLDVHLPIAQFGLQLLDLLLQLRRVPRRDAFFQNFDRGRVVFVSAVEHTNVFTELLDAAARPLEVGGEIAIPGAHLRPFLILLRLAGPCTHGQGRLRFPRAVVVEQEARLRRVARRQRVLNILLWGEREGRRSCGVLVS